MKEVAMLDSIKPIQGWALDTVVELDRHAAGFAGSYLRASHERRQVIAAYLASASNLFDDIDVARNIAEYLCQADHRAILRAAYGSVPTGFRGTLKRSGSQPHSKQYYRKLHALLAAPPNSDLVRTLNQLPVLDMDRLRIVLRLPHEVCCVNVVNAINSPQKARDIAMLIKLLIDHGVEPQPLFDAVRKVETSKQLSSVWKRWVLMMMFSEHPIPASDCYTPITKASDLRRLALQYHNCAERYVSQCLDGIDAFAEYTNIGQSLVVHLRRKDGRWFVEGMFAKYNRSPEASLKVSALAYMERHGVMRKPPRERHVGQWDVLNRLSGFSHFDFDDDE
jgi:hypothetical protein